MSLYHYRARMYDAVSGRFCSRDPIGFVDGLLIYSNYTSLSMTDPLGNTKVKLTNDVSGKGECDSFEGTNNIYVEVTEAGTGRLVPVFLVQHIRVIIEWSDCEKDSEGCCKPGEKKSEKCEYYEGSDK